MLPNRATLATYGGALRNYSAVVDPTTDEDAKHRNWYALDTAMMTHTAPQAIARVVGANGANPTDPVSGVVHDAQWGDAAPVKPTKVRAGEGILDLTWPTTVDTELASEAESEGGGAQATIALAFRCAMAQVESSDGTFRAASAKVTGANTVRVYTYAGTTLDDLDGQTILVLVW